MTIGFVGLDHLGIVSAVTAANKGFDVIAYDPNSSLIHSLRNNDMPIFEPGLQELADIHKLLISWSNITYLYECELIFITIDTPIDKHNKSNYNPLIDLLQELCHNISLDQTIIIMSQVFPGFTRKINNIFPNKVFYQPEVLVVGQAIGRSLRPDQCIIGCENPEESLPLAYDNFIKGYFIEFEELEFPCPVIQMSYESAEMSKIAINTYLAAQVTTTNVLSDICQTVGADWWEVESVVRNDPRIGPKAYTTPGLGLSGGHIERDLETLYSLKDNIYQATAFIPSIFRESSLSKTWVQKILDENNYLEPLSVITIWGVAYKAETSSIKNSPSMLLIEYLHDFKLKIYDPQVKYESTETSADRALFDSNILLILTPWKEFSEFPPKYIKQAMQGNIIIDPYRVLNREECIDLGFKYHTLGIKNE